MAKEIKEFHKSGKTLYACIRNTSDKVWYIVGETFEDWGTDGHDADDYDISLINRGGSMYSGDMDINIPAGHYYIVKYLQSGSDPADTDYAISKEFKYWDGSSLEAPTILTATGVTEGGVWTFAKVMKVINAFAVMNMQLKTGTTATYEILDPDDETTVVAELTTAGTSPPTISILI